MKKTILYSSIAIMLCAVTSGLIFPSIGRIQEINTSFSLRLLHKQFDKISFQSYDSSRGEYTPTLEILQELDESTYNKRINATSSITHTEELKIDLSSRSDYVFKNYYR